MERNREEIVRELAETAAEKVSEIVAAAERRAEEIEAEAREEAERIVKAARDEAREQVDRAQAAVNRLVEQADELRSAIGKLGSQIASQAGVGSKAEEPEIVPEPPLVPEPEPPREPEPEPPREPEPQPPPSPPAEPAIVPEPQPPGPEMSKGSPSTDDLLAQLRGEAPAGAADADANGDESGGVTAPSGPGGEADVAAARLVAMKMALDGASREEIERHLADNYELSHADKLLDDVLARAKP